MRNLLLAAALLVGCGADGGGGGSGGGSTPPGGPPTFPPSAAWTTFTPSPDTRTVYVSESFGNDANDGLGESTPKRTIAAGYALLRDGFPDWMLLRRGDTWDASLGVWRKSGRSGTEPMLVSSYGPSTMRPLLRTGTLHGFRTEQSPVSHLALVGLHFTAHLYTGTQGDVGGNSMGIRWVQAGDDFLVEDCRFENFATCIVFDKVYAGTLSNLKVRRSLLLDSYSDSSIGHAQGLYSHGVDGLLIEENVFDHNGWKEGAAATAATIYNHAMYIQTGNTGVVVRGNVIARASSHGLQLRPGGICEGNLFLKNAIGMFAARAPSEVRGNVFLDGTGINGSPRGWGIEVLPCEDCVVEDNIVAAKGPGNGGLAIEVSAQSNTLAPSFHVTIRNNTIHNWYRGGGGLIEVNGSAYDSLTVQRNLVQDTAYSDRMQTHESAPKAGTSYAQNAYYGIRASNDLFRLNGASHAFASWSAAAPEAGAQNVAVSFVDPNRTISTYHASLGGTASLEAFLAGARQQSKAAWQDAYGAPAVIAYIREGFRPLTNLGPDRIGAVPP